MISLVLVLPAAEQTNGDKIAIALGHDVEPGNTYSVPLSSSGTGTPSHYGCRTWATPGFVLMLQIAKTGVVPEGTNKTLSELALGIRSQYKTTIELLEFNAQETDKPFDHWQLVLGNLGLQLCK